MVFIWTSAKLIKAPNDERHCIEDETNQPRSETEEKEEGSADPAITSPASRDNLTYLEELDGSDAILLVTNHYQ